MGLCISLWCTTHGLLKCLLCWKSEYKTFNTWFLCICLGSNLVSWSSKREKIVSQSSKEVEYRQLVYTAAELQWLRSLFKDLHLQLVRPTIWCDNASSITLASNLIFHKNEAFACNLIFHKNKALVNFICSQDQIADLFTKGLSSLSFKLLVSKLHVVSQLFSLRRDVRPSPPSVLIITVSGCDQPQH